MLRVEWARHRQRKGGNRVEEMVGVEERCRRRLTSRPLYKYAVPSRGAVSDLTGLRVSPQAWWEALRNSGHRPRLSRSPSLCLNAVLAPSANPKTHCNINILSAGPKSKGNFLFWASALKPAVESRSWAAGNTADLQRKLLAELPSWRMP
jgi:hypothetical protein